MYVIITRNFTCRSKLLSAVSSTAQNDGWQLQLLSTLWLKACHCFYIIR